MNRINICRLSQVKGHKLVEVEITGKGMFDYVMKNDPTNRDYSIIWCETMKKVIGAITPETTLKDL